MNINQTIWTVRGIALQQQQQHYIKIKKIEISFTLEH